MADFPAQAGLALQPTIINPLQDLFVDLSSMNASVPTYEAQTGVWPSATIAIGVPFVVNQPLNVAQFILGAGTASGNVDVGVYTLGGAKIATAGSTVMAVSGNIQKFDVTDFQVAPGVYFAVTQLDNTTGVVYHHTPAALNSRMMGIVQATNTFPLPTSLTWAAMAQTYVPTIFLTGAATI